MVVVVVVVNGCRNWTAVLMKRFSAKSASHPSRPCTLEETAALYGMTCRAGSVGGGNGTELFRPHLYSGLVTCWSSVCLNYVRGCDGMRLPTNEICSKDWTVLLSLGYWLPTRILYIDFDSFIFHGREAELKRRAHDARDSAIAIRRT